MSRGLGAFQTRVLEIFGPEDMLYVEEVVALLFGKRCADKSCLKCASRYESVRRAIKALERRGLLGNMWWWSMWLGKPTPHARPEKCQALFEKFCDMMDRKEQEKRSGKLLDGAAAQQVSPPLSVGSTADPTVTRNSVA